MSVNSNNYLLSVIVPAYNEAETIGTCINRLLAANLQSTQLIVVDDGSTDDTSAKLKQVLPDDAILISHEHNRGKAAAIQTGLEHAAGKWVIIQDADLEYDPVEIGGMLEAATSSPSPCAVYGRRPSMWNKSSRWLFVLGVWLIDVMLWLFYRKWVRDHATCYKLVLRDAANRVSKSTKTARPVHSEFSLGASPDTWKWWSKAGFIVGYQKRS